MTELIKPEWQPPNYLFGPVWTILYFLMGISFAFILAEGIYRRDVKIATGIFLFQLFLNVLWSYLFFGWHHLDAAAIEVVILWMVIAITIWLFYRIRPFAAYLLIPYIAWVTTAIWTPN